MGDGLYRNVKCYSSYCFSSASPMLVSSSLSSVLVAVFATVFYYCYFWSYQKLEKTLCFLWIPFGVLMYQITFRSVG